MLNNEMKIDQMILSEQESSSKMPSFVTMTQEEYDLLQTKDPICIYVIIDSEDNRIYLGETLLPREKSKRMYLLGPSDIFGEYTLYLNEAKDYKDNLVPIAKYNNPQLAIDHLNRFNRVGSHVDLALQTYNLLVGYIKKEIFLHELLIGIISLFGYRDDIRLQEVISAMISYGANSQQDDIPILIREELSRWKFNPNHLYQYYSDLYDIVVLYDHFRGKEFQGDPDKLNLYEVIDKIFNVIIGASIV